MKEKRRTARVLARTSLLIFACAGVGSSAWADDAVFRAMRDELSRSMKDLKIEEMPSPYFLSYRVRENRALTIRARYSALVQRERSEDRQLSIELRVGDPSLDNSGFYSGWQDLWKTSEGLVEENSYDAIRHQIWFQTDKAYKSALESLARKRAYLQSHPLTKPIPDFATEEPYVYEEKKVVDLKTSEHALEERVRLATMQLAGSPSLEDWRVDLYARITDQWYLNSEGSRHLRSFGAQMLGISATAQSEDGRRVTGFLSYFTQQCEDLPAPAVLEAEVNRMAADLNAAANAQALDEYVGPVLFRDWAVAQFVSQLIAAQLSMPRKPLMAEDWMNRQLPVGKLALKLKRRILPSFVSIVDRPKLASWEGVGLVGFRPVDDEGVEGQEITLVDRGRLVNLPLGRQPTSDLPKSNGHARALPVQIMVPGISNLIMMSSEPTPVGKLTEHLRRSCTEQGLEFGLLITRLDDPETSSVYRWTEPDQESEVLLTAPLLVYKVYAADGRTEPVRGLEFDDISVRTLRDIAALGNDVKAYNILQRSPFADFQYAASIIAPSILVEEMELKSAGSREPLPVGKIPISP